MNENKMQYTGLIKEISITYLVLGFIFIVAALQGAEIAGMRLYWQKDIWFPAIMIIASIGTLRRTKWGWWISYLISFILLAGIPIGTFLGGFMLWHLTKYRKLFNRWY